MNKTSNQSSAMESDTNSKKRKLRRILVLPCGCSDEDCTDLSIDEDDYHVVREFVCDERKLGKLATIKDNDEERRVYKFQSDFATSNHQVPSSIGRLQNLEHLRCTWIASLPPSIGQLKHLKVLKIMTSSELNLPKEIGDLASLTKLDLTGSYGIRFLPSSIGRLRNLKHISLRNMASLENLPIEIGDVASLETLDLSWTQIKSLPPTLGRLQNLKVLDVSKTSPLPNLPVEIGNLSSLKLLDLTNSVVTSIPPSIGQLKNLEILLCSTAGTLENLPDEIGNLANLRILDLAGISVIHARNFSGQAGRFKHIQDLHQNYKQSLSHLPEDMEGLAQSAISSLPPSIGQLRNLQLLCLGGAKNLTNLPEEIGGLTKLKSLDLSETAISSLPSSIGRLQNLEVLLVPYTKKLSNVPREIGDLSSLNCLDMGGSSVASIPPSIGKLKNLKILRLPHASKLQELPEEIVALNNLKEVSRIGLDVSISSLPMFSGSRKSLRYFEFIETKFWKRPQEKIRRIRKDQWEFLLQQTQSFQLLGSLGSDIDFRRLESSIHIYSDSHDILKVLYALACNRARERTRFGITKGESMRLTLKLWPNLLHRSRRAFDKVTFITEADAIYQLLIDGRGDFVNIITGRKTDDTVLQK